MTNEGKKRRMPAEWEPHRRCWMAWPCNSELWGNLIESARAAYVDTARAIAEFEPVTMVARPELVAEASLACGQGHGISILPLPQDDSWMRDTGPTFVIEKGQLSGVDWQFNAWGETYGAYAEDAAMAGRILEHLNLGRIPSTLTTEGGAIHSDGEGTLLLCEPSLIDARRNPGWDKAAVERELASVLGAECFIWLPYGLHDDETNGHIDNLACFVGPGKVTTLDPSTAADLDREGLQANLEILQTAQDARGRRLSIGTLPIPRPKARHNGRVLTQSYVNFYIANGALIVPRFDDSADAEAAQILAEQAPDREVVLVAASTILQGGGGLHCITQQEPMLSVSE